MAKHKQEFQKDWILQEMMKVAIEDEKRDTEKYRRLAKIAKKDHDQKLLYCIADEERRHRKALQFLYHSFFGKDAEGLTFHGEHYGDFMEAVRKSIVDEYGAVAFYREILNRIPDDRMRMPIRQIMADEQKHAQILEGIMEYK